MVYTASRYLAQTLSLVFIACSLGTAVNPGILRMGAQGVNMWKLEKAQTKVFRESSRFLVQDSKSPQAVRAITDFKPQWFEQPLDHFENTGFTFKQRYWVNDRHYVPGTNGPVFVLDGGETSGEDRLIYLDTGIAEIIANATGGLAIVLEHRYYGDSIPVQNFSTDSMRWLTNDQAAADSANFMSSVKFSGIDEDLTSPNTPWIYYGGSYAGARSAHMKILYPELTYGAIASSAVTHAAYSNWEYMDVIRQYANSTCMSHIVNSVAVIDGILDTKVFTKPLKGLFGVQDLAHDDDFTSLIENPLGAWQSRVWGQFDDPTFDDFCDTINAPVNVSASAASLPFNDPARMVPVAPGLKLDFSIINYAQYIRNNYVSQCSTTVEDCFGTYNDTQYQDTSLSQTWRAWQFQVCTQWGYFTTAPPDPTIPRIISRLQTLPYLSKICKQAYPPGQFVQVPPLPNIASVNDLGGFAIAADRLAFIDGEADPWRPDTPHSQYYAKPRNDTILRPFKLIPGAVHHWDEWGLSDPTQEPPEIQTIHAQTVEFVKEWLKDFKPPAKG